MDWHELPDLATLHPRCCVSLSKRIVASIARLLPGQPYLTLSIGSGSGLFEMFLLQERSIGRIEGVEVSNKINQYLPEELMHLVQGTWDFCPLAADASVWLLCYPKDISLIQKYAQRFEHGKTELIIWIGPLADQKDLQMLVMSSIWTQDVFPECGLSIYETVLIWRRRGRD